MAAGRGERLNRPENKAFVNIAGRPLASYALEVLRACEGIQEITLVVAPEDVERARRLFLSRGNRQTERVVAGGETRQDSVAAGLAESSATADLILIHDAARPFLTPALVCRCLEAAAQHGAVVAAIPASDTIKEANLDGTVAATLDRSRLWLVQTPQVFRKRLLTEAYRSAAEAGIRGTDDASLVERLGHPVHVTMGSPRNIKVTWPEDVRWAEHVLQESDGGRAREMPNRIGIGYDAHCFAEGRPLVLAGVRFPAERGLLGHSDADVVCHAICDALLGAVGAGDIGQHFPDSDPRFSGVSGLALLEKVVAMVRAAGWEIENVDAIVIAEAPRISGRVAEMRRAVGEALCTDVERVSIKGTTTEGMGFTGRGEGMASQAVCSLRATEDRSATQPGNRTEERRC